LSTIAKSEKEELMKRLSIILTQFLLCIVSSGQVLDYFDNEPVWRESCSFQSGQNCIQYSDRQISINGDTTMSNGVNYKSLYIQSDNWYSNFGNPFGCGAPFYSEGYYKAIRQSGDSIFQFWNNEEILALHYNFDIGDTLQGAFYFDIGYGPIVVTSIDSVETDNGWHRRFNLNSDSGANSEYLVEGIGHSFGFLSPIALTVNGVCEFSCYRQNGIYQFGPDNACSVISSVPELSNVNFAVIPNPVTESTFTIDLQGFEKLDDLQTTLVSIDGTLVEAFEFERQSESKWTFNLNNIAPGIYLLNI
jgi:hypothetical protein